MQRNDAAPVFGFIFFLFLDELFLFHCICPQSLRCRLLRYGIHDPVFRSPVIGAVFPCCNARSILPIPSVIQASWHSLSNTRLRV